MKKAIIIGINGQDGSYLSEWLLNNNYAIMGWVRPQRLKAVSNIRNNLKSIQLVECDLTDSNQIENYLKFFKPDEIYNLASPSKPHASWDYAIDIGDVTAIGVTRILEAILKIDPRIRYYQASTSEMFGNPPESPQCETTPFAPRNPYGVAKLYAHWMVQDYRSYHGLYAVSGILFNHESPRRGIDFVTRKITRTAAQIKLGLKQELRLGDLDARRDWGYAPDYVRSMWMMLQQEKPDNYVIGTGETNSVRDFCIHAFNCLGLDYQKHVVQDERLIRPKEKVQLVAQPYKARAVLGWQPNVHFQELVNIMVAADLRLVQKENNLQGEPVECCL